VNAPSSAGPEPTEHEGPIVRDKRRIDPVTGELRVPEPTSDGRAAGRAADQLEDPADDSAPADPVSLLALRAELDERTADLQRVSAEYANYRKRVDRDRQAVVDQALASVLVGLLPVLDDIDRARGHGEVEGVFRSVADNLDTTLGKLGLERYGDVGEPFDPTVHEALTHGHSADVDEATCAEVFQPGYRLGERILRPARVAVVEPPAPTAVAADTADNAPDS
jgi:molecular chaperone GrpE